MLEAYEKEKKTLEAGEIATLKELGQSIRDAKYETKHSSWKFDKPVIICSCFLEFIKIKV